MMISTGSLLLLLSVWGQTAKQTEYLNLAAATVRSPIAHPELERAVLAPEGVAAIRAVFDRCFGESLTINGAFVTPELGGESVLRPDGRLDLLVYPDPIHPVIRELAARRSEPEGLLDLLQASEEGRFLLKNTGGLHALLYQMASAATDAQRALLDDVLEQTVAQHFKTWTTDPVIQARMIEQNTWSGRYVGFWHVHPPRLKGTGVAEGIEPSMSDMRTAIDLGQFVTIVFQGDGFDLYDLSPVAVLGREDLSRTRVIRYRSPEWTRHFEPKLAAARNQTP